MCDGCAVHHGFYDAVLVVLNDLITEVRRTLLIAIDQVVTVVYAGERLTRKVSRLPGHLYWAQVRRLFLVVRNLCCVA
jgi:hypothetical protein